MNRDNINDNDTKVLLYSYTPSRLAVEPYNNIMITILSSNNDSNDKANLLLLILVIINGSSF